MSHQTVFPEALLAEIHLRAQGTPRLINAICDNMLLSAFADEKKVCTVEMLDEISHDLRLEWPGSRRSIFDVQDENFEARSLLSAGRVE